MVCLECKNSVKDCTCGDFESRLMAAGVAFKACMVCAYHYERCRCSIPDWVVVSARLSGHVHGMRVVSTLVREDDKDPE